MSRLHVLISSQCIPRPATSAYFLLSINWIELSTVLIAQFAILSFIEMTLNFGIRRNSKWNPHFFTQLWDQFVQLHYTCSLNVFIDRSEAGIQQKCLSVIWFSMSSNLVRCDHFFSHRIRKPLHTKWTDEFVNICFPILKPISSGNVSFAKSKRLTFFVLFWSIWREKRLKCFYRMRRRLQNLNCLNDEQYFWLFSVYYTVHKSIVRNFVWLRRRCLRSFTSVF